MSPMNTPLETQTAPAALMEEREVKGVLDAMAQPITPTAYHSDFAGERFIADFGDTLRLHHVFSEEPFTKDKFEYALSVILSACGHRAALAPKGNPGRDIEIDGKRFSLKTQADKGIKATTLHISKFMELGKGKWGTDERDLKGLRDQFLAHMQQYDRILSLRYLSHVGSRHYELVEIPKSLLELAADGTFEMKHDSTQNPRPGYCRVHDGVELLFELYFDGGGERKLQVRHLLKQRCIMHAEWRFPR